MHVIDKQKDLLDDVQNVPHNLLTEQLPLRNRLVLVAIFFDLILSAMHFRCVPFIKI